MKELKNESDRYRERRGEDNTRMKKEKEMKENLRAVKGRMEINLRIGKKIYKEKKWE